MRRRKLRFVDFQDSSDPSLFSLKTKTTNVVIFSVRFLQENDLA